MHVLALALWADAAAPQRAVKGRASAEVHRSGVAWVEVLGLWGEADRGAKRSALRITPYQASPVALRSTDIRFCV